MKNILFALSLLMVSISGFAQPCADLQCKTFIGTVNVNSSLTMCFAPGVGVNDLSGGTYAIPNVDTAYVKTQDFKGNAYFVNDSCLHFDSYSTLGTAQIVYVVVANDACHTTVECNAYISIVCPKPLANDDNLTAYTNVSNFPLEVSSNDNLFPSTFSSIAVIQNPAHGTAVVSGGTVNFSGNNSYTGPDTLVYVVTNACGVKDTASVFINIVPCLSVGAVNDIIGLVQGTSATANVLANDTNTAFGLPKVTIVRAPTHGTATVVGNQIDFTGANNYFGLDSLSYSVCTDCGCDTAKLYLNISQAPCTAPNAIVDQYYAGYSASCASTFNVLVNDINPVGGGNAVVAITSPPAFGTATVVNNQIVYSVTDTTQIGSTDDLFYSLCNDCFCDTARLSIVITNYPCNGVKPTILPDYASVCRNDSVWIKVTANDYDLEGSYVTLTDTNLNSVVGQPKFGTVVKADSVTLLYIPNVNFYGVDTFVYQGGDNGNPRLYDQAQVFVTVNHCNNPPVVLNGSGNPTDILYITILEDSNGTLCLNYADADGDWVTTSAEPSVDTIVSIPTGLSPTPCLGIKPPHDYVGIDTVQVIVCDEYPLCDTVLVVINVTPREDAPVALPDVINYDWSNPCNGLNVLTNDYDVDLLDSFTITTFSATTGKGGTVTQTSDSVLCYTANPSFTGIDTIFYTICDTTPLCATTFVVVNVPLTARDDNYTINQEQETTFDVKANDTRFDGEQVTLCSQPQHGTASVENGQIKYTPSDDYPYDPIQDNTIGNGLDSFCYTLCNGGGTCDVAWVYVTIIPKPKFLIPEGFSPSGDGTNDKFVIVSAEEYPQSQLLVYNRWGDEVWRNDSGYQNDFDGNYKKNGAALPDGTYYYIFKFNKDGVKDRVGYIVINR